MPNYRRAFAPGGSWFFTVNLLKRRSSLLIDKIEALRDATTWTQQHYPFQIDAFVVLPDHIHAVWTLPPNDADFSIRWRFIKSRFARAIPRRERLSRVRQSRGERGIWQRRFWEHLIRDEKDYARHVEYCYINPVKHALVRRVQDWRYSSFHRDVRAGLFPGDWASEIESMGEFGERVSPVIGAIRFAIAPYGRWCDRSSLGKSATLLLCWKHRRPPREGPHNEIVSMRSFCCTFYRAC